MAMAAPRRDDVRREDRLPRTEDTRKNTALHELVTYTAERNAGPEDMRTHRIHKPAEQQGDPTGRNLDPKFQIARRERRKTKAL